jgi:hypothetical protein
MREVPIIFLVATALSRDFLRGLRNGWLGDVAIPYSELEQLVAAELTTVEARCSAQFLEPFRPGRPELDRFVACEPRSTRDALTQVPK